MVKIKFPLYTHSYLVLKSLVIMLGLCLLALYHIGLVEHQLYVGALFALLWGYLWGSCMGADLSSRVFKLGDIRKIGSGNLGTTNVLRTGHIPATLLTFLFDAFKPLIPLLTLDRLLDLSSLPDSYRFLTILGVMLGHLYSLWMNFKGGKGIATLGGLTLLFSPLSFSGPLIGLWVLVAFLTRYSSLASLLTLLSAIPWAYCLQEKSMLLFYSLITPLILWRHKDNIQRLINGTETKIGNKCPSPPSSP